ncbi:nuclear transport factor 2 family protein [Azonexus sp. IMCC34839]|uniref:nuclear transport factor 2 family protein n=1 Tax=Azonexus sp. IMCC34839 TaxID=3133695 RepID=UPI00399BFABC
MTADETRKLIERYLDAYNRFDITGMLATMSPDVRFENVANGSVTASTEGQAELRTLAEQSAGLFASRCQRLLAFSLDGDTASAEIAFSAILAQNLPNGPKRGEKLELRGRTEFCLRDGKICSIRDIS